MTPSKRDREMAAALVAEWRTFWGRRVDEWPTDKPMPDSPGVVSRISLADDIAAALAEARAEERKAARQRSTEDRTMKRITLFLLLLAAAPAHAGTFNFNFTRARNYEIYPCDQIGAVTNGGITATFGHAWSYAPDCDNSPSPCFCYNGFLVTDKGECPFAPYYCTPIYAGDFANEPSAGWAGRPNCNLYGCEPDCVAESYFGQHYTIRFNPPIRYFSAWVTGTPNQMLWYCDGSEAQNEPGGGSLSSARIDMTDSLLTGGALYPNHVEASVDAGGEDGTQGSGDPNGHLNHWWRVEVVSPVPVHRVYFPNWGTGQVFVDDIVAATGECPNPPCNFESAQRPRDEQPTAAQRMTFGALKVHYR